MELSNTVDLYVYAMNRDYRHISQNINEFVLTDLVSWRRTTVRQSLRFLLAEIIALEQANDDVKSIPSLDIKAYGCMEIFPFDYPIPSNIYNVQSS